VVLEHEVPGVGPVVRDFRPGVIPHHVGRAAGAARRVIGVVAGGLGLVALGDEPVHPAAVHIRDGVRLAVRSASVHVGGVMVGPGASPRGVRDARGRGPVRHRDPVCPGIGPEVRVEGPVLLHHDDHVLDVVETGRDDIRAARASADMSGRAGRGG